MTERVKEAFPSTVPMGSVRVQGEEHEYKQIEYTDNTTSTKKRYVPNKAPVLELRGVTGIVDGESYEFVQDQDFELIDADSDGKQDTIDFGIGGESPDPGSTFEITYISRSLITRYIESYTDELNRFQEDIDEVIDSHYVDNATNIGVIDTYEDEDLAEYELQEGTRECRRIQSNISFSGDWALELSCVGPTGQVILTSNAGLPLYPKRGDTIQFQTYLTHTDDIATFDFAYNDSAGDSESFYRVRIDAKNDELAIQQDRSREIGGPSVKSDVDAGAFSSYLDQWIRVTIEYGGRGDLIRVRADPQVANETIANVSVTDDQYQTGGIRLGTRNDTTTSSVYFDDIEITDRLSGDLDRIGAYFGQLGKRRGRSDNDYRAYLKSIVQSFSGRGTIDGIKFAVSSGFGGAVDAEDIIIDEDFVKNEYDIEINDFGDTSDINVETVNEMAELADPSGVKLRLLNFGFDPVTDELAADEDFSVVLDEVEVAHTNEDYVQIDVNTTLDASDRTFTNIEELVSDDFSRFRTDEVKVVGWNEDGRTQIDVSDDGGEVTSSAHPQVAETEGQVQTEDVRTVTEQVLAATAGHGRGQIDVSDDGSTAAVSDNPETPSTTTDELIEDDETNVNIDEIQTAFYEDGSYQIDVHNITNSDLDFETTEDIVEDDTQSQSVEQVLVSTAGSGRGQIDVADDGTTGAIGDDPTVASNTTDESIEDDETNVNIDEVQTAFYEAGLHQIDVQNITGPSGSFETTSDGVGDDTQSQTVEQALVSTAGYGRGQIDVAADGSTPLVSDDPETASTTTDDLVGSNVLSQMVEQVAVVGWNENGRVQIDVNDDGGTVTSAARPSTQVSSDGVSDDTESYQTDEVGAAYANEAKVNIDTAQ